MARWQRKNGLVTRIPQCKDVFDLVVLEFISAVAKISIQQQGYASCACLWSDDFETDYNLSWAFTGTPAQGNRKFQLAKMRQLKRRKLVDGCECGCRGDWEITEKGREYLQATKQEGE